jgi:hypothetical protein
MSTSSDTGLHAGGAMTKVAGLARVQGSDHADSRRATDAWGLDSKMLVFLQSNPTCQEIYIITDAKGDEGCRQTTTIMLRGEY